jgi:hypothetical protein
MEKYLKQLKALLKRNFVIKYRTKTKLLSEIIYPLIQIAILILFKFVFQNENLNAIEFEYETLHFDNDTSFNKFNLSISPKNTEIEQIGEELFKLDFISNISYFENYTEMKYDYVNNGDSKRFGIEFNLNENFPYDYTIVTEWNKKLFTDTDVKLFSNTIYECRTSENFDSTNVNFENCDGKQLIYNGFSHLQSNLNKIIYSVY